MAPELNDDTSALPRSRENLASIVRSLDDLVFGIDCAGRFTDFHAPNGKALLAPPSVFIGALYRAVLPATVADGLCQAIARIGANGQRAHFEYALSESPASQDATWWSATVTARKDANGTLLGYTAICRDVTAHAKAEQARAERERELQAIFDLAPIGIAQADLHSGRLLRANARLGTLTGYSIDELLQTTIVEITHPDDRGDHVNMFARLLRGELREACFEKRYVRKDGSFFWAEVNLTLLRDEQGQPLRALATIADISERRAAQAKQHLQTSALQAAANGIVVSDRSGVIQWVNAAMTDLTGYAAEELVGQPMRIFKSGVQDRAFYADLWATLLSGQVWRGELQNKRKDGTVYRDQMTITPVHDSVGVISHFVAIKQDVTAARDAQDQLRAAQKLEAVGRLAGGVAHDFNNLLSVILSNAELIRQQLLAPDPLLEDLNEIAEAARRAAGLTRQLLTFSRKQRPKVEPVALDQLVEATTKMLRRLIGEDIALQVDAEPDLPLLVGDPGQLEQVIMNLVVNARDAMPRGGALRIRTQRRDIDATCAAAIGVASGSYVELRVVDTGAGMDEATKQRIFEPFFTTKEVGQGTGLGLSVVYGIVRACGGGITVHSAPDAGTTFHVYFPARSVDAIAGSDRQVTLSAARARGTETVLLVEDDPALLRVAQRALSEQGYRVLPALSPCDALALCQAHAREIALVLTDIVMPEMDGRALASAVRECCPDAKILYASGYDREQRDIDQAGVEFLAKPYDSAGLVAAVRRRIDAR